MIRKALGPLFGVFFGALLLVSCGKKSGASQSVSIAPYRASTIKNTVSMNRASSPKAPSSFSGRSNAKRLEAANRAIASVNQMKSTGARKS